MRIVLTFLLAVSATLTLHAAGLLIAPQMTVASHVPGEVLVQFRRDAAAGDRQQAAGLVGVQIRSLPSGIQRVRLRPEQSVAAAVATLAADPAVMHVQPNYIYHAARLPNDPDFGQLWGLHNTGQTVANPIYGTNPGTIDRDIDAAEAWDIATDCRDAIVAVLDTGIDYTHPDLADNMWDGGTTWPNHGWDFVAAGDSDPRPVGAAEHHGTHVAGIIAAVGNNARGVTGVCWQARLMAVRVLNANGFGTTADIIEGIDFAIARGAKVINMSLAGEGPYDFFYASAIDRARQNDVLVVTAAGNGGNDGIGDDVQTGDDTDANTRIYPCAFPHDNLLCVAALDQSGELATFSNYGTTSVDLGAPGTNVLSSLPGRELVDDFSGWTPAPPLGWTSTSCDVGYGLWTMLVNPTDWCPPPNALPNSAYDTSADDVIYKTFDLGNAVAASVSFATFMDMASGDTFAAAYDRLGANPFASASVAYLQSPISGEYLPNAVYFEASLNGCLSTTCAVGFRLQDNGDATTATGMSIFDFRISTLEPGGNTYGLINGTSMAAPYVAGIAALVRAYHPDYTVADTVQALVAGGDPAVGSFVGRSRHDRSANARGALRYLAPPTGLSVSVR